ncbi:hypothetical protein PYCC9005_000316 [Savitreella phatthalungensis]
MLAFAALSAATANDIRHRDAQDRRRSRSSIAIGGEQSLQRVLAPTPSILTSARIERLTGHRTTGGNAHLDAPPQRDPRNSHSSMGGHSSPHGYMSVVPGQARLSPLTLPESSSTRRLQDGARRRGRTARGTNGSHDDEFVDVSRPAPPAYTADDTEAHKPAVKAKALRKHEKKMSNALKEAERVRKAKERIRELLPQLYAQLESTVYKPPKQKRTRRSPFAHPENEIEQDNPDKFIDIRFKLRGVDPEMLDKYLPRMFAAYCKQVEMTGIRASRDLALTQPAHPAADLLQQFDEFPLTSEQGPTNPTYEADEAAFGEPSELSRLSSSSTALPEPEGIPTDRAHSLDLRVPPQSTYISGQRIKSSRIRVQPRFFDDFTTKVYFSRRFVDMWKKRPATGKRDGLPAAIAMVLIGVKVGLPLFDVLTFALLDVPRIALQSITAQHTMSIRK